MGGNGFYMSKGWGGLGLEIRWVGVGGWGEDMHLQGALRPLVNCFICPSPAVAGGARAQLPLTQPSFDDARDLLRRKKDIRFTSEPLGPPPRGFVPSAGRGGSGQALPFLPQGLTAP